MSALPGTGGESGPELSRDLGFAAAFATATGWYFWRRRAVRADGEVLQPEYGLGDRVQELLQIQSLEEKEAALGAEGEGPPEPEAPEVVGEAPEADRTVGPDGEPLKPEGAPELEADLPLVVVEARENLPNQHILTVAAALARRFGARVEVVAVTEVPYQVPLSPAAPRVEEAWAEKMERRMKEHGVPFRLHQVLARDRARALLVFTGPRTRVLLLDWRHRFTRKTLLGSYVDHVVRKSPSRVAVLKFRGLREYRKILVATAGSPYATAEVELADAVASHTEATLSFLMVLPPDASEAREEQARRYLGRLPPEYGAGPDGDGGEGEGAQQAKAPAGIQPFPREPRGSLVTRTLRWGGRQGKRGRGGDGSGRDADEG